MHHRRLLSLGQVSRLPDLPLVVPQMMMMTTMTKTMLMDEE